MTQPFQLQDNDDDEVVLPLAEDDVNIPKDESSHDRKQREKEEKKAGVKRVKLGKVELDPNIGKLMQWAHNSIHVADQSDFAKFTSSGPGLDSRALLDESGMINIWVDLKKPLPDLPKDYAQSVREYAVDTKASDTCPPLNVVIFIVGSRGQSAHQSTPNETLN
jgi:hypothetical protein